jgi:hypothetical protein
MIVFRGCPGFSTQSPTQTEQSRVTNGHPTFQRHVASAHRTLGYEVWMMMLASKWGVGLPHGVVSDSLVLTTIGCHQDPMWTYYQGSRRTEGWSEIGQGTLKEGLGTHSLQRFDAKDTNLNLSPCSAL